MRTISKSLSFAIAMMVITVGITSCGSDIPKGDNKDVATIIADRTKKTERLELQHGLMKDFAERNNIDLNEFGEHLSRVDIARKYIDIWTLKEDLDYDAGMKKKLARSNDYAKGLLQEGHKKYGALAKKFLAEYPEAMKDPKLLKLEQITTVQVDKEAKVAMYRAVVVGPGVKKEVEYTAQYDTEGNVIVRM